MCGLSETLLVCEKSAVICFELPVAKLRSHRAREYTRANVYNQKTSTVLRSKILLYGSKRERTRMDDSAPAMPESERECLPLAPICMDRQDVQDGVGIVHCKDKSLRRCGFGFRLRSLLLQSFLLPAQFLKTLRDVFSLSHPDMVQCLPRVRPRPTPYTYGRLGTCYTSPCTPKRRGSC